MIARQRLELLPAAGSGDTVETDLEVVAVPDIEVLLVVPPCADPQAERWDLARRKGVGSPDGHIDREDRTPTRYGTTSADAVDHSHVRVVRPEEGVSEGGATLEAVLLEHRDRDRRRHKGSRHS